MRIPIRIFKNGDLEIATPYKIFAEWGKEIPSVYVELGSDGIFNFYERLILRISFCFYTFSGSNCNEKF